MLIQGLGDFIVGNPDTAVWLGLVGMVLGPAGAVWAVFKFKLNGLASKQAEHLKEERKFREESRGQWVAFNAALTEERHERRLLAKHLETICPYWTEARTPRHALGDKE